MKYSLLKMPNKVKIDFLHGTTRCIKAFVKAVIPENWSSIYVWIVETSLFPREIVIISPNNGERNLPIVYMTERKKVVMNKWFLFIAALLLSLLTLNPCLIFNHVIFFCMCLIITDILKILWRTKQNLQINNEHH